MATESNADNTIVRSRYCGLRDVYAAVITQNNATGYVTETPVKLGRAITAKISDKWSSEKVYSDDGVEENPTTYEGTDVEFEVNTLAPQDRAMLCGHKYENGFLVKNKDDIPPEVALGYRTKRRNGKYEFVWLLCGTFGQGIEDEHNTQEGKPDSKTSTIKGEFYERELDGAYHVSVDESQLVSGETSTEAAKTAIADWFSKVQEPTTAADDNA